MKTIYALVLACLSLPASALELEFVNQPAYDTPVVTQSIDTSIDYEDYSTVVTPPATKPLEGYSFDAGADFNFGDENTGSVAPAQKSLDYAIDIWAEIWLEKDDFAFKPPVADDLYSIHVEVP